MNRCASAAAGASFIAPSENLDVVQRMHIETVLQRCGWKINGRGNAAERLGVHPNTLRFRMKKLGVASPGREGAPGIGAHAAVSVTPLGSAAVCSCSWMYPGMPDSVAPLAAHALQAPRCRRDQRTTGP